MKTNSISRTITGWSLVLAPLTGLVAAAALPALRDTRSAEIAAIARHQDRFYVYALGILLSSYLLVPAFFGIINLLRERSARWAYLAGGLAQVGMLVAIGDAATELMFWQMGSPTADHTQMTELANRYESAAGSALVYDIGGLAVLIGTLLVAVGLWRTRVVPRWAAAGVAVSVVANLAGFATANQPILVASYLVMLAALGRVAAVVLGARSEPTLLPDGVPAPAAQ
ncbi:MAG TPA: hypothetical protein VKB75_17370 [Jatrophihabitans sp.]|nr:hypothetical protein [Jatrophihabitans sp.]